MKVFTKIISIGLMSSAFMANAMEEQGKPVDGNWAKEYRYKQIELIHNPSYVAPPLWTVIHTSDAVIVKIPRVKDQVPGSEVLPPAAHNTTITPDEIIMTERTGFTYAFYSPDRLGDNTFSPEVIATLRTQSTQKKFEHQIALLQTSCEEKEAGGMLFLPILPDDPHCCCSCVML